MNENHAKLCPSPEWAEHLQTEVLPWFTDHADLGDHMLEIGPGPGAATDWLRTRVKRLTVLEIDQDAGTRLAEKYAGSDVEVLIGDATRPRWPGETFDSIGSFTMLHHVPTAALQNKILTEALRLLKPGGALVVSDSIASDDLHHFHVGDTYNPIDPASVLTRLQTVGFGKITIAVDWTMKFVAHKPSPEGASPSGGSGGSSPRASRAA
jgi:SAM-dependent methyltransferase